MSYLEKLACRFLIYRFRVFQREGCITPEDWQDGEVLHDGGCFQCRANMARKFLKTYLETL